MRKKKLIKEILRVDEKIRKVSDRLIVIDDEAYEIRNSMIENEVFNKIEVAKAVSNLLNQYKFLTNRRETLNDHMAFLKEKRGDYN